METGEIIHEKVFASPRPPPISFKDERIGFGSWRVKTSKRLVKSEQPSGSLRKSKKCLVWLRKHQREHGRFVKNCVLVSVECLDEDKDAEIQVMADFSQNRLWPKPTLAKTEFDLFSVCVCVCLCVFVCVGFTVSVWGFQSFCLVMFRAPGPPFPGPPSPGPPKISLFLLSLGGFSD